MKMRFSHVTNSSSSSFIISKDQIDYNKLIEVLLEIANKEYSNYDDEDVDDNHYTLEDDITLNHVTNRYRIKEATKELPLNRDGYKWNKYSDSNPYDNHWFIDNQSCVRYDWDIIEDILDKYGIEWQYGYCD